MECKFECTLHYDYKHRENISRISSTFTSSGEKATIDGSGDILEME